MTREEPRRSLAGAPRRAGRALLAATLLVGPTGAASTQQPDLRVLAADAQVPSSRLLYGRLLDDARRHPLEIARPIDAAARPLEAARSR